MSAPTARLHPDHPVLLTHPLTRASRYFQTLRLGAAGWLQLTAAFCIHFGFMVALYFYLEAASASSGGLSSLVQVCLDCLAELQSQSIVFQAIHNSSLEMPNIVRSPEAFSLSAFGYSRRTD